MDIIDENLLKIIADYLSVKDYKNINKVFNKLAKNKASIIISKNLQKFNIDIVYYMNKMAEIEFASYYSDNFEAEINDTMKNYIITFYKKVIPVVQRNYKKCEYIIEKQLDYLEINLQEYIRISTVRVEFEMSDVYLNNTEMVILQRKLTMLALEFKKTDKLLELDLEYEFCNKYVNERNGMETSLFHIENLLYMSIIEFLAGLNFRLNSFCDEYILYIIMKDISHELILAVKDRLNALAMGEKENKVNYNLLIENIEPSVLIKNNYYMFK